jgi:GDP-L-fucose synthase
MATAFREEFGCNFVTALPTNLYGPGDDFDLDGGHVIPAMIRKFLEAKEHGSPTVTLWGDGSPTRDLLFVRDAARGLVLAAQKYDLPAPLNLGTGEEVAIRDLARRIADATGYRGAVIWDGTKPNGQPRRCLDTRRARELLGWSPRTSLDEGLKMTIEWYTHQDHSQARTQP